MPDRFKTYSEFFDFYLSEHTHRLTRVLHYVGSTFGLLSVVLTARYEQPLWLLAGLVAGYGCAWIGHFFVEKNKPATFTYPVWSFIGDYHMYILWLTGALPARRKEAARRRANPSPSDSASQAG